MSSAKPKIIALIFSTTLLFACSGVSVWLPYFVEKHSKHEVSLDKRVSLIEAAIEKMKREDPIDKSSLSYIFESQIESELANDSFLKSTVELFKSFSQVLVGLLLVHLVSVFVVIKYLVQKKT